MNDKRKEGRSVAIGGRLSLAAAVAATVAAGMGYEMVIDRPYNYEPDFVPLLPRERDHTAPRSPKQRFRKSSKR